MMRVFERANGSSIAAMTFVIAISFTFLTGTVTFAQAERFQMIELNEDGERAFLRVDLENGAISRCVQDNNIWQCVAIEEQSETLKAALERRIDELEDRVAQLEADRHEKPDMEELGQALDMSEQFMRRFFGMVQDMKKDMAQ